MNFEEIAEFRRIRAQLDGLHQEFSGSTKKDPDKPVTVFKIRFVNRVLAAASHALAEDTPFPDFEGFDEDDIPTSSDVSLVVTQYIEASEKVRCENITRNHNGVWYWVTEGSMTTISTPTPHKGK